MKTLCLDCGQPSTGWKLCGPCADVAALFGHSVEDRLALIGHPTLGGGSDD